MTNFPTKDQPRDARCSLAPAYVVDSADPSKSRAKERGSTGFGRSSCLGMQAYRSRGNQRRLRAFLIEASVHAQDDLQGPSVSNLDKNILTRLENIHRACVCHTLVLKLHHYTHLANVSIKKNSLWDCDWRKANSPCQEKSLCIDVFVFLT